MNTLDENQKRAAQLRKPHGEEGIKTGEWMSHGNRHIIQDSLTILNAVAGDTILEIGMGNGQFVTQILEKHANILYTGCDYSELMVEEAKKQNTKWISEMRAQFLLGNAKELPFEKERFSKILTVNTLYFWDKETVVLNEFKRVLKPSGKLIIGFRPKHQTQNYPFTKYGFTQFSKEEAIELVANNGFRILSAHENKEPDFELNGQSMSMQNIVLEASKL